MKIKYKIYLLRKEFNSIRLVRTIKLNEISNLVKNGGKTFSINIAEPSYVWNNYVIYFVDIDTNSQMFFSEKQNALSSTELDLAISNKMLNDIMKAESTNAKEKMMNMILGFVVGFMLSAIIALLYITNNQNEIVDSIINGGIIA